MKKNYISPSARIVESSSAEVIIACSPTQPKPTNLKRQYFGTTSSSDLTPDVDEGISDVEGGIVNLSKERGFYDCY